MDTDLDLGKGAMPGLTKALLVGALVLGIVLGFFGFQWLGKNTTTTVSEKLDLAGEHVWFYNTQAEAAITVTNYGEEPIKIRGVSACGLACNWSNVYFVKGQVGAFSSNLQPVSLSGTVCEAVLDGKNTSLSQASGEILLDPEWEIVLYMKNPGGITSSNAPNQATITIRTYNDVYEKEAPVTAWIPEFNFMGTEQLSFTAYTWNSPSAGYFNFTVKNTGSSGLTITDVRVDGTTPTTMYYRTTGAWALFTPGTDTVSLDKGASAQFSASSTYVSGIQYEFTAITAKGQIFGPYIKTAP